MNGKLSGSVVGNAIFYVCGAVSLIVSLVIYLKTMAPTVSFWDCGEFIASSYILGVPHPPGTPLFILVGKFFMLLGIMPTPAQNTNFISVLASALTNFLAYLLIVKVSVLMLKPEGLVSRLGICIGALAASLMMGFASTYWFNAVETEVYGLAMFLILLIPFLAVKWGNNKASGGNDTLIIAITYLLFLSIGIHLTVFLVTPALVLFFAIVDPSKMRDWRFWVCWAILFSFAVPLHFLVLLIFPLAMDYSLTTWLLILLIFTAICVWQATRKTGKTRSGWAFYAALGIAAIVGLSPHLYIPIRAAQNPAINENRPNTLRRFENYMSRKQYGQESMVLRMFRRRGSFAHQFGVWPHMGFWGYFRQQYNNHEWLAGLWRYLPFLIGLFGMYLSLRHTFKNGFLLALIFLISSLGLILYLNFSDGTRGEQLEVRDRDYFYTPAFIFFAIIIGLGLAGGLCLLWRLLKEKLPKLAVPIWFLALGYVILLPIDTISYHWRTHDRTGDYMPPDYAYNILNSCAKDGIIFTNGDNDTFPLWYLQEVEKVRRDVRVVNLSLLNTDWYIYQLKHFMGVPIELSDEEIVWHPFDRRGQIVLERPRKQYYDPIRKTHRYLVPFQDAKTGNIIRVQDQMIEHIIWANKWRYPIYFSTSVPTSNRWTLSDYTLRKGMALEVVPEKPNPAIDAATTREYLYNLYRYRGVSDLNIYKDENNVGLTTTYPERFMELARYYLEIRDTATAKQVLWDCVEKFPYYYQSYIELKNLYPPGSQPDSGQLAYDLAVKNLGLAVKTWPEITLYRQFLGVIHYANQNHTEAIKQYEEALKLDPSQSLTFRFLLQLYSVTGQKEKGRKLLTWWIKEHPEDLEARNFLKVYR